jgi:2'-5' RNA ligase
MNAISVQERPESLIRCFIAIQIPLAVLAKIGSYVNKLKNLNPGVRWVNVENIHLTLKFLAEISPQLVQKIEIQLLDIQQVFAPFGICIEGSGCFPGKSRPRVFWLGLEQGKNNPLFGIHNWIESKLIPLGFEKERRRFSPHLTIGRVKKPDDYTSLFKFIEKRPFQSLSFNVNEIHLVESILKPSGAEYRIIHTYPFSATNP